MDDRERLFFEHDVATPLSNLRGAEYLLRASLGAGDERTREALDILSGNIRNLERMLAWYWRVRSLRARLEPAAPWPAKDLPATLERTLREAGSPVPAPVPEGRLRGALEVPQELLCAALAGAGLTLAAASGCLPSGTLSTVRGVLRATFSVPGDRMALDPPRLFRKYHWPGPNLSPTALDAGLPFAETVLEAFGGSAELAWEEELWTLVATLPLLPVRGLR